jgi:hypothetical protein
LQVAPLELRERHRRLRYTEKTCYHSAGGYGCPWQVFPRPGQKHLLRHLHGVLAPSCPHDNLAINLGLLAPTWSNPPAQADEAFKAFIMWLGHDLLAVMWGWGS